MTIGSATRGILGKRLFARVGKAYRSVFVNLEKVALAIEPHVPKNGYVIDIGGGDGEPLNYLMAKRSDIHVDMIDLSANLGGMLKPEFLGRIKTYPCTSIAEFSKMGRPAPDCVIISDVIHHVPAADRRAFFDDLKTLIGATPVRLIIKDVEPGSLRSALGYFADRFISGDKNVSLISQTALIALVTEGLPGMACTTTPLMEWDSPNYALVFTQESHAS